MEERHVEREDLFDNKVMVIRKRITDFHKTNIALKNSNNSLVDDHWRAYTKDKIDSMFHKLLHCY